MSSFAGIRIIFARYFALYRWYRYGQPQVNSSPNIQNMISNQMYIQNTFRSIKSLFRHSLQFNQSFQNSKINSIIASKPKIYKRKIDIYTKLANSIFTTADTKISYQNNCIYYFKPKFYQFSIAIKDENKFRLKSFSLYFPAEIKQFIQLNHSQILAKFALTLSKSIAYSKSPIDLAQKLLHQFYIYEIYLFIVNTIISLQHQYNFTCKLSKSSFNIQINFSSLYSPYNKFNLCLDNNSIYIISRNILNKQFYSKRFSIPINKKSEVESAISHILDMLYETKIEKLYSRIQKSLIDLHIDQLKVTNSLYSIDIQSDNKFVSIVVDKLTGQIKFKGKESYLLLIPLLEKETTVKTAIEMLYLHSLSSYVNPSHIFIHNSNESKKLLHYSSISDFSTQIDQYGQKTMFYLLNRNNVSIMPNLIMPLNYLYTTYTNLTAIKIIMIYSQISLQLNKKGIHSYLHNDSIEFVMDLIDSIQLKITPSFYWTLKVSTFQQKATFSGNSITLRFPKWISSFAINLSTFLHIYKQAIEFKFIKFFTSIVYSEHFCCFSIRFGDTKNLTTLRVSLFPFQSEQHFNNKQSYYVFYQAIQPSVKFEFFEIFPLTSQLTNFLNNGQIRLLFGTFLNGSILPLLYYYRVFAYSKKWSMSSLRNDGSFYLVYNESVTINLTLNSSQMFHLTIPLIGKSNELKIPLSSLPSSYYFPKLSHPIFKIPQSQLIRLKELIENFFNIRDSLTEIGFVDFVLKENELIATFPKQLNYANIHCNVKATSFGFTIEGDNEIARNIDNILNHQYDDNDVHLSIARFVINVLDFDQKFAAYILYFTSKMISKSDLFKIDWRATMERTAVTLSEHRVIFNFVTMNTNFCIELTKKPKDPFPDILCYDPLGNVTHLKAMKELAYWIHMIALGEPK